MLIGHVYADTDTETGKIELRCKSGGGFAFITESSKNQWKCYDAYPGRKIELPVGEYIVAFTRDYKNGMPEDNAQYYSVQIDKNACAVVSNPD